MSSVSLKPPVKSIFVLHVDDKALCIDNLTDVELKAAIKAGRYTQAGQSKPNFSKMPLPSRLKDGNIMNFRGTVVIKGFVIIPE